ncbi:MAG: hypothetical protein P8R45_05585 [Candidatus Binatia bacterium]|nr:hypothetical protein [Candidatus Binatia bacterium]
MRQKLGSESSKVLVYVNIWPKYAPLVRDNSVFWNASGVKAHFGLFSGLDVSLESLESLIAGGIAFATPDDPGAPVPNNSYFKIAEKPEDRWLDWAPRITTAASTVFKAPVRVLRSGVDELKGSNTTATATETETAQVEQEENENREERREKSARHIGGHRPGHRGF